MKRIKLVANSLPTDALMPLQIFVFILRNLLLLQHKLRIYNQNFCLKEKPNKKKFFYAL